MDLNHDRIRSRLQDISRAVDRLSRIRALGESAFLADVDSQDIARARLLTAMEACLNICYHVCAKKLKRVPENYGQCFSVIAESGVISSDLGKRLSAMVGLRNRLVHMYWDIDYRQIYRILSQNLEDLEQFSREILQLESRNP